MKNIFLLSTLALMVVSCSVLKVPTAKIEGNVYNYQYICNTNKWCYFQFWRLWQPIRSIWWKYKNYQSVRCDKRISDEERIYNSTINYS